MAADPSVGFAAKQNAHLEALQRKVDYLIGMQRESNDAVAMILELLVTLEFDEQTAEMELESAEAIREQWLMKHRQRRRA